MSRRTPRFPHSVIAKPVTDVTGVAIRKAQPIRLPVSAPPPAAPFLSTAKERAERTPPKPRFWNPFRGRSAACIGSLPPREWERANFIPCFRIASASTSAGRSRGPVLPWHSRGALCAYRAVYNFFHHSTMRSAVPARSSAIRSLGSHTTWYPIFPAETATWERLSAVS